MQKSKVGGWQVQGQVGADLLAPGDFLVNMTERSRALVLSQIAVGRNLHFYISP